MCIVTQAEHQGVVGSGIAFQIEIFGDLASGIIEIDDMVFFAEGGESSDETAIWERCDAASVKDQFVITPIALQYTAGHAQRSAASCTRGSRASFLPSCQGLAERLSSRSIFCSASTPTGSSQ